VSDLRCQVVVKDIPASAATVDATVGAGDFFALGRVDRTFILIAGATQVVMGPTSTTNKPPLEWSTHAQIIDTSTVRFTRDAAAPPARACRCYALLLEYTGIDGGPNEFIVRDTRVHSWAAPFGPDVQNSYGPISSVVDPTKVVMFAAGVINPNSAGPFTGQCHLIRGRMETTGGFAKYVYLDTRHQYDDSGGFFKTHSAWQAVEFTGSRWTITQGVYAMAGTGTSPAFETVSFPKVKRAQSWVYCTRDNTAGETPSIGYRVWLRDMGPSLDSNELRLQTTSDGTASQTFQWYIISHPGFSVQQWQADGVFPTALSGSLTVPVPVTDLASSFAWLMGEAPLDPTGQNILQAYWQFALTGVSTISIERGADTPTSTPLDYDAQVIEFADTVRSSNLRPACPIPSAFASGAFLGGSVHRSLARAPHTVSASFVPGAGPALNVFKARPPFASYHPAKQISSQPGLTPFKSMRRPHLRDSRNQ
jgi:hypothetical protein